MLPINIKKSVKLYEYLSEKARMVGISDFILSKKLMPGSSGSFIASIKFGKHKVSEKKINLIAKFFGEDPNILVFKAERIPEKIQQMIFDNEDIQKYLIRELKKYERKNSDKKQD